MPRSHPPQHFKTVAVPQLLALGSTLAGILSDWLAKS
ncbi:hypothetical protein MEBOL_005096 [Melittangium boletus DSM 14713]|uniref:Uncharacterized protein n=1 Tax=Melittangium boletus DSM 14713 TaxID=1294270 RepID=A0A250IK73_9BACT|nr:hypothetical protein MEBOL_005096 [Melittangium boletus DSM 14713]